MIRIYYHDKNLSPALKQNSEKCFHFLILKIFNFNFRLILKGGNGIIRIQYERKVDYVYKM